MKKYIVTGGLGFLGQHVVKALLENDEDNEIIILARSAKRIFLDELNDARVKIVNDVDITQKNKLARYFQGADYVVHVAALISFWYKDRNKLSEINVTGTKNVVNACLENKITRLVHVSSTATIKGSKDIHVPANETNDYDWEEKSKYDYGLSKYYAEKEIERGVTMGLDAVIANPCSIIGYGDTKFFPLIATAMKQIPFCFSGGSHLIDARDLARGIALLITKGEIGERYLFTGAYHSQKKILTELANLLKVRAPLFVISSKALALALPILAITDFLSPKAPGLTKTVAENGLHPVFFCNLKSREKLGWEPQYNLDESLKEIIRYYQEIKQ
jgi:nucleoside-diphosphate-sugar epimerase